MVEGSESLARDTRLRAMVVRRTLAAADSVEGDGSSRTLAAADSVEGDDR